MLPRRLTALTLMALLAGAAPALAVDRVVNRDKPIVGTQQFAQPAQPADAAPPEGSRKRFIKASPSSAPRLSPKPVGVSPILPPLALKGHTESPPSTTAPIKAGRSPVNAPPPPGTQP